MIFIDEKKVELEGNLKDLRLELTIIMSEIRDATKGKLACEEIDEMLHEAVDVSGKSCKQLLEDIAKMIDEIKKEL